MSRPRETKERSAFQTSQTSWDPIADWYKRWAGVEGSAHHRLLAIPAVLDLLSVRSGETVLDVGCGSGVLAPHIARAGASYVGVDLSPKLLAFARKRHGGSGIFLRGDACRLKTVKGLRGARADAVVFLLSIQDMGPLEAALESAAWALKPEGRIVLLMTHPCFRVPRSSGWGWDPNRKLQFRRVDRYLTPLTVPVRPLPGSKPGAIRGFHRPLQAYCNELARLGFLIDRMIEMPTTRQALGRRPKRRQEPNEEIPVFLGLRARRLKG